MSRKRAFTLLELLVATGIGAFILLITGLALIDVIRIFRRTSGHDEALRNLIKARQSLELDLRQASASQLLVTPAPGTRGGGADGDAIDTLSAVNVTTGQQASQSDGSGNPYLFQNLIYYVTTPTDHDSLFSASCVGGNEGGYDYNCPHKILLRLLVDQNPAYDPSDASSQDTLLPSLGASLTQSSGFPKSQNRDTVAINLLSFRVTPQNNELVIKLMAVSIPDARRKLALGSVSLRTSPYTVEHTFSVFPHN